MRVAVIDLGTNTFNLLIQDLTKNNSTLWYKDKIAVKLGEGGINKKVIQKEPYRRGIEAIERYLKIIENQKVDSIYAFATNAIRSANNGDKFVAEIAEKFKLKVHVIDGDREAELIYKGVRNAYPFTDKKVLIMDIGGGSPEFIIANKDKVFWQKSFHLGAARLVEKFKHSEPIKEKEITRIEAYINDEIILVDKALEHYSTDILIGSSGSFETLADIVYHRYKNKSIFASPFTYLELDKSQLNQIIDELLTYNVEERLKIKGMLALRVDMMVVAIIFIRLVMKRYKINKIFNSDYALKEGILEEIIQDKIK